MKKGLFLLVAAALITPVHATWKKTVTKNGQTTVTGDADTMAQEEKNNKAKAEYDKEIAAAPRRQPTDPIRVTVLNTVWDGKNKNQNENNMNKALFEEMKKDPLFVMKIADINRRSGWDQADVETLIKEATNRGQGAEIFIHPTFGTEAALGTTAAGKTVVANALMYKADVSSKYEAGSKSAKELGNIMQSQMMIKNVSKSISDIIKNDYGPRLPSSAAVNEINHRVMQSSLQQQTGILPTDDTATRLKKLFKPRNQVNK